MLCGWLILAATVGQTTQPATPASSPLTKTLVERIQSAATQPAGRRPHVVLLPPLTLATQPAGAAKTAAGPTSPAAAPVAAAPAKAAPLTAPTTRPVPSAVVAQPVAPAQPVTPVAPAAQVVAVPPTTQPAIVAAPAPVAPITRETVVIPPAASQPGEAGASVAAAMRRVQGGAATQPAGGGMVLPPLSGDDVSIDVTPDGKIIVQGSPSDVAILQQFIQQLQRQTVPAMEVRVFELKNARATEVSQSLERFWRQAKAQPGQQVSPENNISIVAEPRSNSLMIAVAPQNMNEIQDLINKVDQSTTTMKFYPIKLKYIKAQEAQEIITKLLTNRSAKLQNTGGPLFDIQSDPRTNSLLISAPPADIQQIQTLVELIDVEPSVETGGAVKMAIYPLEKAVATDLVTVLTNMLNSTPGATAAQEQIRRLQLVVKGPRGAERQLTPLNLEKPIKVLADSGTNSVIVASIETNIAPIGEIIRLLDQMPLAQEVLVRIYPLEHADAQTLLTSLKDMFAQGKTVSDVPGKAQVQGRTPDNLPGAALVSNVAISTDARTNALIVGGKAEQLLLVEQVVKAVDVPNEANRFPPRLVHLDHSDATKLATGMQKIVDARQQVLQKAGPTAASREQVLIIPDPRTNSLVIVAKEDNFAEMAKLAKDLDTASAAYLGQIHIINLDKLNAADLGPKLTTLWQGRAKIRQEAAEDQPVFATDSRSNSLIIASNQEDYEVVAKLVNELEQQKLSPIAQIRSVRIQHNDTTKIADTLRKLFDERAKMKPKGQEDVVEDHVAIVEDPMSRMLLIASTQSNYDEIIHLVSQLDTPPSVNGLIRMFPIRNADVTKTADMIKKMFDSGIYIPGGSDRKALPESLIKVTIEPDVRSSAIVVSASPENIALVEELLKQIDRADTPNIPAEFRFFQLQNADALRVADMLDQIFEGMRTGAPKEVTDQLQMKVIPNTRTNTLVVSGSRLAVKRAADLIPELDKVTGTGGPTSDVKVYSLKNAPAPRLAQVLTDMFQKSDQGAGGGKVTPMNIIGDDASNSLIVTAPRERQDIIKSLLLQLDVPSSISKQMEVITLKEAKAEQVADTLTKLLQQSAQGTGQKAPPGFAITPETRTNSLLVFAPPDAMAQIHKIVKMLDTTHSPAEMALRVFQLRNSRADDTAKLLDTFFKAAGVGAQSNAKEARQLIIQFSPVDPATGKPLIDVKTGQELVQRLVHQDITITPDPNTNSLVVLAPAGSIDMMSMLVEMLDSVTPQTTTIQPFQLVNADATEMKKLLDDLFSGKGATGGGTQGNTRRAFTIAGEGGVPAAGATGESNVAEVAFATDERTNSLIAAGSPSYLKIVERLVLQLDYKEMDERTVRVVHLRNAKATEVATTMKAYFQDEASAIEKATQNEAAPKQLQRHVTIEDSGETSNSLLLSYSPRMESQIISMINELDQPPPQVMIQVLMAEVTLNDRFEMGMEFALQDLLFSEKATVQTTPNGSILHGPKFDTVFGTDVGAAGSGTGVNFTVTGEDFNFLFHALQTEGRLEVLSRPSILVRDNQEATFTVGERVPTVQDINISANGQVTPSVTYEEVGVILGVTPIINPDGFVNMEVKPEISAIGTSGVTIASGVTLPTFTQRKADTSVTVKDGETIIIGGLITSQENASETKLPVVGDVPILGWAFRANTRSTTKTELLIVLTPHVIRDPTQARIVSVNMRDQTGINDNIRMSPLMQGLQVTPEEDQFGPIEPIRPGSALDQPTLLNQRNEEQGPELDEYGPPAGATKSSAESPWKLDADAGPTLNRSARTSEKAAAR